MIVPGGRLVKGVEQLLTPSDIGQIIAVGKVDVQWKWGVELNGGGGGVKINASLTISWVDKPESHK